MKNLESLDNSLFSEFKESQISGHSIVGGKKTNSPHFATIENKSRWDIDKDGKMEYPSVAADLTLIANDYKLINNNPGLADISKVSAISSSLEATAKLSEFIQFN